MVCNYQPRPVFAVVDCKVRLTGIIDVHFTIIGLNETIDVCMLGQIINTERGADFGVSQRT